MGLKIGTNKTGFLRKAQYLIAWGVEIVYTVRFAWFGRNDRRP
jgi:hypothetical protein